MFFKLPTVKVGFCLFQILYILTHFKPIELHPDLIKHKKEIIIQRSKICFNKYGFRTICDYIYSLKFAELSATISLAEETLTLT